MVHFLLRVRLLSGCSLAMTNNNNNNDDDAETLSPLRAHYLKKTLVELQFNHELAAITHSTSSGASPLSYLGPPFNPPPKNTSALDLPFLRYIFRQFVLTFPFMASAPKDFYSSKLQPFVDSILSRNLSASSVIDDGSGDSDQASRKRIQAKTERGLSLFISSSIKLAEKEDVVRLTQADLDRLETLAKKRQARLQKLRGQVFEVNVVAVRTVVNKGRIRSHVHEEFIIRTRRSNTPDVFVSRRYGDFKTLVDELHKAHPSDIIPQPPAKDKSAVPAAAYPSSPTSAASFRSNNSNDSLPTSSTGSSANMRLSREKNRLTLRAYLTTLLNGPSTIANSPVLRSFLLSDPITLTSEEIEDARMREEADAMRDDGRKRFAHEISKRVDGLRAAVKDVKGDAMGKDGLTRIFATIKTTSDVHDLPANYLAVLEWGRISLASTIFHNFVASDSSSELFASLKRIHGLMPYFMMKAALKISNPMGMVRTMLDLFLAQPFGGPSLLQRMFTSSLTEEVKALQEDIDAVKEKIEDPVICEKIRLFVYAPREIQQMYKADAAAENMNVLTVVLRAGEEPVLNREQMHRVARAHRAHTAYVKAKQVSNQDSDDDDGPQDDDAWLFEDLKILTQLYSRLRDREQIIEVVFEGTTSELLKDIITIFYSPLAQVYKAASIADSLGDLQNFINDLIRTVEQADEISQEDPQRTVQSFIDLVQRHEQSFYSFVHKVHSKGEGLFNGLMRWIELFLTVVREGLAGDSSAPISLEYLLPHAGEARRNILQELDEVAKYHYKLKVQYEERLRRRFGKAQQAQAGASEADREDVAAQALVEGVVSEISFGDLVQGDANDAAAEEDDSEEEYDESDSDEYETDSEEFESAEESVGSETASEESVKASAVAARKQKPTRPALPPPHQNNARHHHHHQSSKAPQRQPTAASGSVPQDEVQKRRPRALSLKSLKRSMSNLNLKAQPNSAAAYPGRKSVDSASPPPVPPLPPLVSGRPSPVQKDSQSSSSSAEREKKQFPKLPPSATPVSPSSKHSPPPLKSKAGRRVVTKAPETAKQPGLKYVPELLPLFVEMLRPSLQPRRVS